MAEVEIMDDSVPFEDNNSALMKAPNHVPMLPGEMFTRKNELLTAFFKEKNTLLNQIMKNPNGTSIETIFDAIAQEFMDENTNLKGNELIFEQDGMLHDATTVGVKRAEILEKLANIAAKRAELTRKSGAIDLRSTVFIIFQQVIFEKMLGVMQDLKLPKDEINLITLKLGEAMKDWDKVVQTRMDALNSGSSQQ